MIRARLSTLASTAVLGAMLVILAACGIGGPSGAGWRDANLHAVDGIWITGEDPCAPAGSDERCSAVRAVALAHVPGGAPDQASVAIARLPVEWVNDRGERILTMTGGISKPLVAIVDLADGRRVAVGMMCDPAIDGNPPRPATCFDVPGVLDPYRVGGRGFHP